MRTYTAIETSRPATRLLLALEAWKLRHGSLPKTLEELVGTVPGPAPGRSLYGRAIPLFSRGAEHSLLVAISPRSPGSGRIVTYVSLPEGASTQTSRSYGLPVRSSSENHESGKDARQLPLPNPSRRRPVPRWGRPKERASLAHFRIRRLVLRLAVPDTVSARKQLEHITEDGFPSLSSKRLSGKLRNGP